MKIVRGILVSPGIALGKAFVYPEEKLSIPNYDISVGQVEFEFERFKNALDMSQQELSQLKEDRGGEISETESKLIDAHLLMTRDPELSELVNKELAIRLKNVEWVLLKAVEEMVEQLNASGDAYLRERSTDIHDVSRRIMGHLLYRHKVPLTYLEEDCILVAHNLLPSDVISMDKQKVIGIATDVGGKTSHTAILARSFEIPAVLGLSDLTRFVKSGDEIIVDGNEGLVILDPDEATRKQYQASREAWLKRELQLLTLNELPAETRDGKLLLLEANIEIPEEVDSVLAHGADGIGLYRSEFLYILPHRFPLEEEQVSAYKQVLESMNPRSVTIRTLDLGGDKLIPSVKSIEEGNPILGWRAVRFCIAQPDIFKTQLRALLRASVYGNLKIMFPMISGIEELNLVLELFEEAKEELRKLGVPFKEDVPVGIMIEVPSAAFTSDILAKKVDFFSIGTNDLIQYTIAVDRENERIAYLYEPFHPGVLRLIKLIIDNGHNQGISVGMCGEMAGDTRASIILLGLGLDEFSMSAIGIPEVKKIIRSVTIAETEEAAGNIMEMKSYREIDQYMNTWMEEKFDFVSH
jgi:phosphotransferase system enzyme I (PtsI)